MLGYVITFFILAVIAGVLGFGGLAAGFARNNGNSVQCLVPFRSPRLALPSQDACSAPPVTDAG